MTRKNLRRTNGTKRNSVRRAVLRSETHCHLCGGWVNQGLPAGRPGSPEVDEVVPVTYGGSPYDRSNCRLAHRWCNRYRWYRPVAAVIDQLHEDPPTFDAEGERILSASLVPVVSRRW